MYPFQPQKTFPLKNLVKLLNGVDNFQSFFLFVCFWWWCRESDLGPHTWVLCSTTLPLNHIPSSADLALHQNYVIPSVSFFSPFLSSCSSRLPYLLLLSFSSVTVTLRSLLGPVKGQIIMVGTVWWVWCPGSKERERSWGPSAPPRVFTQCPNFLSLGPPPEGSTTSFFF